MSRHLERIISMKIILVSVVAVFIVSCSDDAAMDKSDVKSATKQEKKVLYWVAPMDPTFRRDKPGKSAMGMDLLPVYDDGAGSDVKISPAVENNMGVRTAKVVLDKLWKKINTVGYVDFDENKITHIHLRTKGWIDHLYVKSEGERVKKGQLLFDVYSPELVNAQEEYVQALRSSNKRLLSASQERLISLGISQQQINQLKKSGKANRYVQIYATQNGIVSVLNVREGTYVMPNTEVMSLADLSSIWVLAEVFESQADWVKVGQSADVTFSYKPGRAWGGFVEYIYPSLNPKTRTLRVRLRFDNPNEDLKPNMFANIAIYGGAQNNLLIVPREAVIRTGNDARVILAMGDGKYQARNIVMGIESGDWIAIKEGVLEGDRVVTSGQFLIDSEASLKASIQRMGTGNTSASDKAKDKGMTDKIIGIGVVQKLMPAENKINISHQPIEKLGWPDMKMDFSVQSEVDLSKFKPNDVVEFELKKGVNGYEIKSMQLKDAAESTPPSSLKQQAN